MSNKKPKSKELTELNFINSVNIAINKGSINIRRRGGIVEIVIEGKETLRFLCGSSYSEKLDRQVGWLAEAPNVETNVRSYEV